MKKLKEFWKRVVEKFAGQWTPVAAAVALALLPACSSTKLMRCDGPMVDPVKLLCKTQISGKYRLCEKADDVYDGCVAPQ
jgi:hypothetical protein